MKQETVTTQVDVIRHGECEGGNIFRGSTDVALLAEGLQQMHRHAKAIEESWDRIISSPLQRCSQFAQQLSEQHAIPTTQDKRLREMHFGDWEGIDVIKIYKNDNARMRAWGQDPEKNPPPNGEPLHEVKERVQSFLDEIHAEYRGEKILVVTHGGVIRVVLAQLLSMPIAALNRFDVPYACVTRFAHYHAPDRDTTKLLAHNFIS